MTIEANPRYLTLIRHAKSSWDAPAASDFDRPLNKRGQRDAPAMGSEIARLGLKFDRILCSSAVRARQTLSGLEQGLGSQASITAFMQSLYLAPAQRLYEFVSSQDDRYRDLALIGHNPGMEDFAGSLSGGTVDRMPTCCVVLFAFEQNADSWKDALENGSRLEFLRLARELGYY